ncbi:hypothetical protein [Modestobacter sp. Leaf380]|uniref:hypothetical protein n=1 Tax=Modestobacter sp. Leaf380 TaxID=1736356 RepID=UPI0012F88EEE|nr:hypothetical protein [Modestobacter sp. Leaf380]
MRRITGAVAGLVLLAGCTSQVSGTARPAVVAADASADWAATGVQFEVGDPPEFPRDLDGWALQNTWSVLPRAFEGQDWTLVPGADYDTFPSTMNGCDTQRFLVRWRVLADDVEVEAGLLDAIGDGGSSLSGSNGYMSFDGCLTPAFRLPETNSEYSTLTDVTTEVQQYYPAP